MLSDEGAKAIQASAKAASELRPELRGVGHFLAKALGRSTEQANGLLGDVLAFARIELSLRFYDRVQRKMDERGMDGPTKKAALAVVFPILQAASVEEEDDIAEMFADLLVNAVDDMAQVSVSKAIVETVRRLSPVEAKVLQAMANAPADSLNESGMMFTCGLPVTYHPKPSSEYNLDDEVPADVSLALATLTSLGCVECAATWGGATIQRQARVTIFGQALINAATARPG